MGALQTTSRGNGSNGLSNCNFRKSFASGAFKNCYLGAYTQGTRAGEPCVHKVFKSGSVFSESYFDTELSVVVEAMRIVERWNSSSFIMMKIRLNSPEIWEIKPDHAGASQTPSWNRRDRERILVEPYIAGYKKWNSNTGWCTTNNEWGQIMQALSHFSYHITGGRRLLCDCQGGVYVTATVLTDPAIISLERGKYGPTDLGEDGIVQFFTKHVCNSYCRSTWSKPKRKGTFFKITEGTSMASAPTIPVGAKCMSADGGGGSLEHMPTLNEDEEEEY